MTEKLLCVCVWWGATVSHEHPSEEICRASGLFFLNGLCAIFLFHKTIQHLIFDFHPFSGPINSTTAAAAHNGFI